MASPDELFSLGAVLTFGGIGLFFDGFRLLNKKRLVEDMPTSKIRSIAMGLVEIKGKVVPEKQISSPLMRKRCVYYYYCVEVYKTKTDEEGNKRSYWEVVDCGERSIPFYLKGKTGKVLIDPTDANTPLKSDIHKEVYYGGQLPPKLRKFAIDQDWFEPHEKYRFTEQTIRKGEKLYVLGTAGDNPRIKETTGQKNVEDIMIQKGNQDYIISDVSEKSLISHYSSNSSVSIFLGPIMTIIGIFLLIAGSQA